MSISDEHNETCKEPNCSTLKRSKGLCGKHYMRLRRNGDPSVLIGRKGSANGRWKGGVSSHELTDIYHELIRRCTSPSHTRYSDYGGRGISVHPEWVEDFWVFVRDVGERPKGKTKGGRAYWQLDRINNDGNYEPGNVRWATPEQQANNKRGYGGFEARRDPRTGRFT